MGRGGGRQGEKRKDRVGGCCYKRHVCVRTGRRKTVIGRGDDREGGEWKGELGASGDTLTRKESRRYVALREE